MSGVRKFMFDSLDFDAEEPTGIVIPATPPVEPEPSFTLGELEAARIQAFEEGRSGALAEAAQGQQQTAATLLARIAAATERLVAAEAERNAQSQAESVRLAISIMRKMLPGLARRNALGEIEAMIADCLSELADEPRIVVRVHDGMLDALKARIDALAASKGFAGKMVLLAEPSLMDTDCRVEWADGGAERDVTRLWQQIERLAHQATAAQPAARPQTVEHANLKLGVLS